ncbi:MAG: periplasmic heavy metal sensor [Thermodesulfobacteriota bacterium]|nr:periplasmic heavy metal sensor [Thermodesulfobacteriota bacterium]
MLLKLKKMMFLVPVIIWISVPINAMGRDATPGRWWRMPKAAEKLGIKDKEKKELDDLYVKSHRLMIDLKSSVEKERFELDNLIDQENLDENAIMDQFKKLEGARAYLATERFHFLLQVRKILGPERYRNLKMTFKEFREKRRHRKNFQGKPFPGQAGK